MDQETLKVRVDRIIDRDIHCRQNATVELFQQNDESFWDDVQNLEATICPHCGDPVDPDAEENDEGEHVCPGCSKSYDDPDTETKEVMEWWAVSNWLADKLQGVGEVVWEGPDVHIWGRTTTGQSIELDGVIQGIVQALGD